MDSNSRLGMIGIGNMGHGIASNLVRKGHPLAFLQPRGSEPVQDLLAGGATSAPTIGQLVDGSDVVLLCVTGTPEVEALMLGDDGVLAHLRPGMVVIDHTTAIPSSTGRLADRTAAAGGRFLDAPMTGTPKDAEAAQIQLLVGADDALFGEVEPLLAEYARKVVHAGPVGAGHTLKLLHNFVSVGFAGVLSEAIACARGSGIDVELYVDVLANGGGRSTMLDRMRPYIETGDTSQYRFSIANAAKDIAYYAALADELGAAREIAVALRDTLAGAVGEGHGAATLPELTTVLAER